MRHGHFTLPGEAGFEELTLEMAKRWGADVIRDSDGTELSDEILRAGYGIYSTICPIREHNQWIKVNPAARQQTFLSTAPKVAQGKRLDIPVMRDFFAGQFEVNDTADALRYWQVFDRTTDAQLPREKWSWNPAAKTVELAAEEWHQYTVSFLAWRIWEEISMYNHVTNGWKKERLLQLNPFFPAAREYLKSWLRSWCEAHPATTVVRFTSLFYNFVWIWGGDERNRNLFTDWASYDFTVCPAALDDFAKEYGYPLCAEDFVRQGKYNATHRVPDGKKLDWMAFMGAFVRRAARDLVDIVHEAGKEAYVFYDDSWVGMEPYNGRFEEFGFDGIIKCVFSGYEVRLCAGVPVKTHEIRFHPYLFPVGLGGAPTFSAGGHPGKDALEYWVHARRALLRQRIERAGLGGYLHLVREYPDFVEAMDRILEEFRAIEALHGEGKPHCMKPRVGVLTAWGKLRSWTLSGHFLETHDHLLIHVLESLAGLPFDVKFLAFADVKLGDAREVDVIINAGYAGDAWSGGSLWHDVQVVDELTAWVHRGGVFLGIGEPSAVEGYHTTLRMAHMLGIDIDHGEYACHGRWSFDVRDPKGLIPEGIAFHEQEGVRLMAGDVAVLGGGHAPAVTMHSFGKGQGIYLSGFAYGDLFTRLLRNLLLFSIHQDVLPDGVAENVHTECAVFPDAGKAVFINHSGEGQKTDCHWRGKQYSATLEPYAMRIVPL